MDIEKLKKRCGYDGKPQQWQYGFDLACRELAQAVPENKQFNLDEFLSMEEKLKSKGGIIKADLDRFIAYAEMVLEKAKAQAVPEGFVLVPAEQMSQWGHMANYAEQYGCPECFEARGYAHSLACEINEFFAIEPQESAND